MKTIKHKFVEFIPERQDMEDGVIYISLDYDTAVHSCLCGCGQQVVTPLSPTDWKLTYNGESVTLYPSIGNWEFDCRSHYWIRNGKVNWAESWSDHKINSEKIADIKSKHYYYDKEEIINKKSKPTLIQKLKFFFLGK